MRRLALSFVLLFCIPLGACFALGNTRAHCRLVSPSYDDYRIEGGTLAGIAAILLPGVTAQDFHYVWPLWYRFGPNETPGTFPVTDQALLEWQSGQTSTRDLVCHVLEMNGDAGDMLEIVSLGGLRRR
jgi:hypothetical protein